MRAHDGRGRWTVAVVLAGSVALGACRTDREITEPEPVPVTEERLAATLVTVDDLPEGWAASEGAGTPIDEEVIPEHECDDRLGELEAEEAASSEFTAGGVTLTSTAAWFPGQGGAVEQLYRDVAADCAQAVAADAGVSIRAGALDFGVLSDDTLPIRFEVEPTSGPITERDLIVMRQGDLVHVIRLTGPRPSDKALLDGVVRIIIGRLGLLHDDTT